jgi:hypothetical protein
MEKIVKLDLNKYTAIPASLQNPSSGNAMDEILIDMAGLFHRYYLDTPPPMRELTNVLTGRAVKDLLNTLTVIRLRLWLPAILSA